MISVRYAEAPLPTEYGTVRFLVYRTRENATAAGMLGAPEEHVALVVGEPGSADADGRVLVRVHSECWTGEVLRSYKCDCGDQLEQALRSMVASGCGVLVYLRQEGRGIGLGNKIRAYALQEQGHDTVDANRLLGFGDDERTYDAAADILADLGIRRVALMTNNPNKINCLVAHGIDVERVPLAIAPNAHNALYLSVKVKKMGHEV